MDLNLNITQMCKSIVSKFSISFKKNLFFSLLMLLLFQVLSPTEITAQGNLLLMPRRIVFEGAKRYEEINLANTGSDTAKYVVSFMQIRMKEDGGFEEIKQPDSGQNFADRFLRFFPRSVSLAPNEAQVVKVQLTRINELQPGEYRSHLYFRAIPVEKPLGEKDSIKDSSISVKLVPVFGISIPVIIRVGESTTKVSISDISLQASQDKVPGLNMIFHRSGNMSVYGDVFVDLISADGKTTRVGTVNGIAIYTPTLRRQHHIDLLKIPGIDYHSGKLHVLYTTQAEDKSLKIAEAELDLH